MDKIKSLLKKMTLKDKLIIVVCAVLLGLLLVSLSADMFAPAASAQEETGRDETHAYKLYLESRLKETLENVAGVGQVELMITLAGEISKDIIYNETTSSSGSLGSSQSERTSKEVVMEKTTSGSAPYSAAEIYPQITGVIVVAQGAADPQVEADITQAVKVALGVAAHKIVVLTKKE